MTALKRMAVLAILGATVAAAAAPVASAQVENCGMYKYHDEETGKCLDARNRPSGKTWAQETLEKKWAP